jgi:hypothetical protein
MKKQILFLALLVLSVLQFCGCDKDDNSSGTIQGSGNYIDVTYSYSGFKRIDVSDAMTLNIHEADSFYVQITVDDNLSKYLDVYTSGNWLVISMEDGRNYKFNSIKAEVYMPDITDLTGSGASMSSMNGFDALTDLNLILSGASIFGGMIGAVNWNVELSGASEIYVGGFATNLSIYGSGASVINIGSFEANNANVNLSGASADTINVLDHLDAKLSGASILNYYGDPTLGDIELSRGSTITKLL